MSVGSRTALLFALSCLCIGCAHLPSRATLDTRHDIRAGAPHPLDPLDARELSTVLRAGARTLFRGSRPAQGAAALSAGRACRAQQGERARVDAGSALQPARRGAGAALPEQPQLPGRCRPAGAAGGQHHAAACGHAACAHLGRVRGGQRTRARVRAMAARDASARRRPRAHLHRWLGSGRHAASRRRGRSSCPTGRTRA